MEAREELITFLNKKSPVRGKYVLYWMQQAQRTAGNPAMQYALQQAHSFQLPLVTVFIITEEFPEANLRHYSFMMEGLYETAIALQKMNILFLVCRGKMVESVSRLARKAVLLVTDRGYTGVQRSWKAEIADRVDCPMSEVESEPLFPVEQVMQKEAYNARVLRDRIYRLLPGFSLYPDTTPQNPVLPTDKTLQEVHELAIQTECLDLNRLKELTAQQGKLQLFLKRTDASVKPSNLYKGGYAAARKFLTNFIDNYLAGFFDKRNDPGEDCQTNLSPYLHFGQISNREILLEVISTVEMTVPDFLETVAETKPGEHPDPRVNGALELFEEMVVRRELSMNFCHYNPDYDQYSALPAWARTTLREHVADPKPYLYDLKILENAETHDPYWNAAQKEMLITGKMHGYMRMYWGKKIIEWSAEPEEAFQTALFLNNKYELDGRDPNGFAGVAWCFGKHDRAWSAFPIMGKVRTMKESGLTRKFNMKKYLDRIEHL